jgi:hypothetical protein
MSKSATRKVRIQLDLRTDEANALDELREHCAVASRADAVRTALAVVEWIRDEISQGKRIFAVGRNDVSALMVPGLTTRIKTNGKTNE